MCSGGILEKPASGHITGLDSASARTLYCTTERVVMVGTDGLGLRLLLLRDDNADLNDCSEQPIDSRWRDDGLFLARQGSQSQAR
mmetsp:Transcript_11410/g.37742  ORF Transcript_11410/g.37742 Transcript_11410/m.37742 type:complete len:85 (-) Transcript_11410:60-314(-)